MEVPSPLIGTVTGTPKVEPGQKIKVGDVLLTYEGVESAAIAVAVAVNEPAVAVANTNNTPAARRIQTKTPAAGAGQGRAVGAANWPGKPRRRSERERPRHWAARPHPHRRSETARPAGPRGETHGGSAGESGPTTASSGTRVKIQGVRRKIAEHCLVKAKQHHSALHSYVDECDVTELGQAASDGLRETVGQAGVKLTYLPFFVKAVVAALKEVPIVNASLVEADGEIVLHDRYNIGIAVSTPSGLIVPVIRDADKKDIATLARDIERLSNDARNGKSKRDDLLAAAAPSRSRRSATSAA